MKSTICRVVLFLVILVGGVQPVRSAEGLVRIATGEWPPYTSENLRHQGAAAEIVTRTFQKMGVAIELVFYPWPRCYESVRAGRVWGAFPYAQTEERGQEVDFSDILLYASSKLFYFDEPPPDLSFQTILDLKGLRIGGVRGYYYESLFSKAGVAVDYAPGLRNGLEKLMLGRNDLFVANELVGWFVIRSHFIDSAHRFGTLLQPLDRHGLKMIVSRQHPLGRSLLDAFNQALAAVKDDLFYEALLKKLQLNRPSDGD